MRAPAFWNPPAGRFSPAATALAPLAWAYSIAGRLRRHLTRPVAVGVPVICIGNLVAGGAGKTPVAISLVRMLAERGLVPHVITRGYGGTVSGPLLVDASSHSADQVGDEALLLAAAAPTWVARDRVQGARAAIAAGATVLVLDDGFQNPGLAKDISLVVVDASFGYGNGRVLPAGPLREPPASGLARAAAVVVVRTGGTGATPPVGKVPTLTAQLAPTSASRSALHGAAVVAFAGIGRPQKFFESLAAVPATICAAHVFADHHRYTKAELAGLEREATANKAILVTTAKDWIRLPPALRGNVSVLHVDLEFDDPAALMAVLAPALRK